MIHSKNDTSNPLNLVSIKLNFLNIREADLLTITNILIHRCAEIKAAGHEVLVFGVVTYLCCCCVVIQRNAACRMVTSCDDADSVSYVL